MISVRLTHAAVAAFALLVASGCDASRPTKQEPALTAEESRAADRIEALQSEGAKLASAGDFQGALTKWQEGLAVAEKQFGDGPYVEVLLTSVGLAHANLGRFAESEAAYKRAIAMRDRLKLKENSQTSTLFLNAGLLYANTDRPAEAEPLLRRALDVARRHPEGPPVEFITQSLADVLRRNGKGAEADALAAA